MFLLLLFSAQRFQQIHCLLVAVVGMLYHKLFRLLWG